MTKITLLSKITCPGCQYTQELTMPTDACQWFYECTQCHQILEPLKGDCCVFCSFATVAFTPIQQKHTCCEKS